jgi:uncharacterized surface protein with fasciclin (FAS1) repeats
MKMISNIKKAVLIMCVATLVFSCTNDDDNTTPESNTIAAIASRTPNLSILVQALVRADLVSTLDGEGSFTVFAPTNDAFNAFLGNANINDIPVDVLREVLLNHVVLGSVQSSQLSTGYISTLATGPADNKLSMYVSTETGVNLNGVSNVLNGNANVIASNGVIHVVDAVIGLPTVVTFATADPNFELLVAALTREDHTTDFVDVLSGEGLFTVFAPINSAFESLLADDLDGIGLGDIPLETLDTVLKYHVIGGANVLSGTLTNGQVVTPLTGGTFTINTTGGASITDGSNRISNIIAVDVQATNGVIHALDKVLLP